MEALANLSPLIAHADGVIRGTFVILLAASIGSWTLILTRLVSGIRQRRASRGFLTHFWRAASIEEIAQWLRGRGVTDPFSHLVHHGFNAVDTLRTRGREVAGVIASASPDEFLTRALRRAIEQDRTRLENGLTFLASVASIAPFVGLFGTVWGIYHALSAISAAGTNTLEAVAGPVGEALIMTGVGLAVAIPAALAYNLIARENAKTLSQLNAFAYDVFAFLSTGVKTDLGSQDARQTGERVMSLAARTRGQVA